jgi:hypothetical protein
MKAVICPFCGVAGDVPHETQQACIEALQAEIARTRRILENITEPLPGASVGEDPDPQLT